MPSSARVLSFRRGGREGRPRPTDSWRTPPWFFAVLDREFGFQLDAACERANCLAPAGLYRDEGRDGLLEPWEPGPVWCNPPYSQTARWISKGALEGTRQIVVMPVPADTSTRWWADSVARFASEIRFVVGRLRFLRPDGTENVTARSGGGQTTPSAVVVYRPGHLGPPAYSYIPGRP